MIRNFIYLDEDKMYSLSSQLFEGVTEYVLDEASTETEATESQKGPLGSGRILGDILKNSERRTEKKFLNDYSFNIFEDKLEKDGKIITPNESTPPQPSEEKSFVKIRSKAVFNDINTINASLKDFNKIGKALAHVTNQEAIAQAKEKLNSSPVDRNQKARLRSQIGNIISPERLAKESGLYQDQEFLNDLALLLGYGFQDQLEVQMHRFGVIYSANLNRRFLREPEELIIRKYSRRTEIEFTLLGVITQYGGDKTELTSDLDPNAGIRAALMNLVHHLSNVEASFTGRLSNEVIVDPIALYTEV